MGTIAILCGSLDLYFTFKNKENMLSFSWHVTGGCGEILAGILLFYVKELGAEAFPLIIFLWILLRAFFKIGFGLDTKEYGLRRWYYYTFTPVFAIICAIAIALMPSTNPIVYLQLTAVAFFFLGIYRLASSFNLYIIQKRRVYQKS